MGCAMLVWRRIAAGLFEQLFDTTAMLKESSVVWWCVGNNMLKSIQLGPLADSSQLLVVLN